MVPGLFVHFFPDSASDFPLLKIGKREVGHCFVKKVVTQSPGIFLFFIPVAVIEVLLRRAYPNMQNLISEWANFLMFITVFIFGFIMMSDDAFGEAIDRHWKAALICGLSIVIALSVVFAARIQTGLNEVTLPNVQLFLERGSTDTKAL